MHSLLISQVGYHKKANKRAFLRSADAPSKKAIDFSVFNASSEKCVYSGTFAYWGEKWGSYWWEAEFSEVSDDGSYYLKTDVTDASNIFTISNDVFISSSGGIEDRIDLAGIAMDQLDARLKKTSDEDALPIEGYDGEYIPGWRDCGTEIRELSSHIITLHGLLDMYESSKIYGKLSESQREQLLRQIKWGAEYIMFSQEHSEDPLYNGRFNHDSGMQTDYGTTGYHNWHGTAYAITALVRTNLLFCDNSSSKLSKLASLCLESAKLGYENAVFRPYNLASDFQGRTDHNGNILFDDDMTDFVNELARVVYDKPDSWCIPTSLKTKDKITFLWACTLLYKATKEDKYRDMAIE
ncbi:MAG: glycoside hydrolase family 9 protein [Oscillospiraceae bacterium]|nr:glycoside hydrolase family 9 protein [Oscillospiraceae bacterium]